MVVVCTVRTFKSFPVMLLITLSQLLFVDHLNFLAIFTIYDDYFILYFVESGAGSMGPGSINSNDLHCNRKNNEKFVSHYYM